MDQVVKRTVNKFVTVARIARLTAAVAVVAGLSQRNSELENAPPNGVEKRLERLVSDATGTATRDARRAKQASGGRPRV